MKMRRGGTRPHTTDFSALAAIVIRAALGPLAGAWGSQCKRAAKKAANVKRHKQAMRRARA